MADYANKVRAIKALAQIWISDAERTGTLCNDGFHLRSELDRAEGNFFKFSHPDNHSLDYPYFVRFVQLNVIDKIDNSKYPWDKSRDLALIMEGKSLAELMMYV